MTARPRPGPELTDDERFAAVLGDALYELEHVRHDDPTGIVLKVIGQVGFVRAGLIKRIPAGVDHGQEVGE